MLRSPTARATLAVGIVVTALVTAVIHVMLAVGEEATPTFQILFLLAAAGFVAGLAARFIGGDRIPWMRMLGQVTAVPTVRRCVAWAMAPSTLHTNGLWPWRSVHGWK